MELSINNTIKIKSIRIDSGYPDNITINATICPLNMVMPQNPEITMTIPISKEFMDLIEKSLEKDIGIVLRDKSQRIMGEKP